MTSESKVVRLTANAVESWRLKTWVVQWKVTLIWTKRNFPLPVKHWFYPRRSLVTHYGLFILERHKQLVRLFSLKCQKIIKEGLFPQCSRRGRTFRFCCISFIPNRRLKSALSHSKDHLPCTQSHSIRSLRRSRGLLGSLMVLGQVLSAAFH